MLLDNVVFKAVTGEDDNSFVGIKLNDGKVYFCYPDFYFMPSPPSKKNLLDILRSISFAKTYVFEKEKEHNSSEFSATSCLSSCEWIIGDYIKNGFPIYREKQSDLNLSGKIDWRKTLKLQPILSNNQVIYPKFYKVVKRRGYHIFLDAYKYCLKCALTIIGWLYGISPNFIELPISSNGTKYQYLLAIRHLLYKTYNDDNQNRLHHMENILLDLKDLNENSNFVYGVSQYYHVYESMIDVMFGSIHGADKKDYNPKFNWHLRYSPISYKKQEAATLRPDSILRCNEDNSILIIDSKYYRYGIYENYGQSKGLPGAESLTKQKLYGEFVTNKFNQSTPDLKVFNAFILPFNSHGLKTSKISNQGEDNFIYVGFASPDNDSNRTSTYSNIYTFCIDLKYLIENYFVKDEQVKMREKLKIMIKAAFEHS